MKYCLGFNKHHPVYKYFNFKNLLCFVNKDRN
jgi:hypothetical protein